MDLQATLEHREQQIAALRRVSEALYSHLTVDELVRETLAVATDVLQADAGSLQMYDEEKDALVFRYVASPDDAHLVGLATPVSKGLSGRVFRTGLPDLTHEASRREEFNPDVDQQSGRRTRSLLTVPLKRPGGECIGVLQVLNAREHFDERDLGVLEVMATQAAIAIENARLAEAARKAQIVHVIGNISHDIKNMLTPIQTGVWTLEAMLDEASQSVAEICAQCPPEMSWGTEITGALAPLRADSGWIIEQAVEAAEMVQAFTRDLADAVKGELAPPVFEEGDLNATARDVARALKLVADKAGVALRLDLDLDAPLIHYDRQQMYNALYNLANNAIPETPAGGSVTLRTRGQESTLLIEVQDTGRGIPERVRERLFTEQAISTKPGGTGLGTRIVAGVVERHHGEISVASAEGRGSTFTLRLPLRPDPAGL
jgi:signal transduction histidine kinase